MSSGTRITLANARALAQEVVALIGAACDRVEVAGSIRRGKPEVGDVDLVVQVSSSAIDDLCDQLLRDGTFGQQRKSNGALLAWGQRHKAASYKGVAVDLFIVRPDRCWGPTFLIRTGPGSSDHPRWKGGANQLLVTNRSKGGILPDNMKFADGQLLRDGVPLDVSEESDVFAAIGLPFIPPEERSIETYLKHAAAPVPVFPAKPLQPFQVIQFQLRLKEYPTRRAELYRQLHAAAAAYRDAVARETPLQQQMEPLQRDYDDAKRRGDKLAALEWLEKLKPIRDAYDHVHEERLQAYSDGKEARYYLETCERLANEAADALGVMLPKV